MKLKSFIADMRECRKTRGYEKYGRGNGYVILPKQHPLYGLKEIPTFDEDNDVDYTLNHILKVHGGDDLENCNKNYVEEETENLKKQLEDVKSIKKALKKYFKDRINKTKEMQKFYKKAKKEFIKTYQIFNF